MSSRTFPLFSPSVTSSRDSFYPQNYYRRSRFERYRSRDRESAPDLMKTIDLRGRESVESYQSFSLSDILEDEEIEIVDTRSAQADAMSTYRGCTNGQKKGPPVAEQPKRLRWFWYLCSALLQRAQSSFGQKNKA